MNDSVQPLLVYGDWIVDEYWFLVHHQSDVSRHTGFIHYRVSTEPGERFVALCGAGHVASVVYALRSEIAEPRPEIWGLGRWSSDDTAMLGHLIHCGVSDHGCQAAQKPYGLQRSTCDKLPEAAGIHVRNLRDGRGHTIQVARLYHQEGTRLEQISRIDWEPKPLPSADLADGGLPADLPPSVGVIVVEDFVKGAVTASVVRALLARYPDARWHVRTKDKTRGWLTELDGRLDLLVVGPEIAALKKPWRFWLSEDRMTLPALELLQEIPQVQARHLVALTNEREVFARLNADRQCVTGHSNVQRNPLADIGWPSAFFAALSWQLRNDRQLADPTATIDGAIRQADRFGSIKPPLSTRVRPVATPTPTVVSSPWVKEVEIWRSAQAEQGLVVDGDKRFLDVWRGSTNLPGYVVCIGKKQEVIDRMGRHIRRFSRQPSPQASLSMFLQADPGSGKTYLAQTLARAFDCDYIHFDITQMMHREELLHIFDGVAAKQAESVRTGARPVLVFVDEINAQLDASHVFGAFLAPVENGFYVRHGQHVMLRPCIWLFAGTRMENMKPESKYADFISRMTLYEEIDFTSLKRRYAPDSDLTRLWPLYAEARLEQVYVGASMINKAFPHVRFISRDVLFGFWKLDPEKSPSRILRRLATGFNNVQHGVITAANWDGQYEEIAENYLFDGHRNVWLSPGEGRQLVELRFTASESYA